MVRITKKNKMNHKFPQEISCNGSISPEVYCKKCVLKIFAKFTGKHQCWSLFFDKVAGFLHRAPKVAAQRFP